MVIRIVRMHFKPDKVEDFLTIFNTYKQSIRNAKGCTHLELLKDAKEAHILSTLSWWKEESYLEQYRTSDLFKKVWPQTKALFSEPPKAYSFIKFMEV